jgi:predicted DNA-binding transcriptional regulator AlpA
MSARGEEWLTVPQVLEELGGVSRRTFYRWRELGNAPKAYKLPNGELRFRRRDFERWLDGLQEPAA